MLARVALLNPPGDRPFLRDHYCSHVSKGRYLWQPYDLLALSGALHGHVELLAIDAIAEGLGEEACLERLERFDPDVVFALSGAVSWRSDVAFFARLDERVRPRIFLSGDIWLFDTEERLARHPVIDGVLLDFTDCDPVGLVTGSGQPRNVVLNTPKGIRRFEASRVGPFALGVVRHELFEPRLYGLPHARQRPLGSLMTSLGCPYRCGFCPFERLPFRLRDLDDVALDLKRLDALGYRELWLKDQTFGASRKHAQAVLDHLDRYRFSWSAETRPDVADLPFFERMARAGCHTVLMGVEAADQGILDRARKDYRLDQVHTAFAAARAAGLRTLAHFALGLPGETEGTLAAVAPLIDALDPDFISVNLAAPMVGTSFRDEAEAQGWIDSDDTMLDSSTSPATTRLPGLDPAVLEQTRDQLVRGFYTHPGRSLRRVAGLGSWHEVSTLAREALTLLRQG